MGELRTVSSSQVQMTELVLPSHTNALGSVFGGVIMSWIDIAAAICAGRHSRKTVVTASIDDLDFVAPVYKGWIVNLQASVNYAAHTSVEVGVRVHAENPITGKTYHTASAYLTFVALDENLKPTHVPKVLPENADEKRRYEMAQERREFRLKRKKEYQKKHPSKEK